MTSVAVEPDLAYEAHDGDIPEIVFDSLSKVGRVAWDIETSGLNWASDRIALCQIHADRHPTILVRLTEQKPQRLTALLENDRVAKIFHHAMFDLRFMAHQWKTHPRNIACTKIAAKILLPRQPTEHHLQSLVARYLGVSMEKTAQRSDWTGRNLAASQIVYAIRDVIYLPSLLDILLQHLANMGRRGLAQRCFAHIPTRVELDLLGLDDVYTY